MHPFVSPLFAAAFRGDGFDAVALPPEDVESFELGRTYTRGSECLPACLTTGSFLNAVYQTPDDDHALFMPCADGPCRFGQYASLQRVVLNRLGLEDVPVLSPSSLNTYAGLSRRLRVQLWHAILFGDILFKCGCKLRPYEQEVGAVETALQGILRDAQAALEAGRDLMTTLAEGIEQLVRIPLLPEPPRPLVGIVGEIYVRSNPFSNANLVRAIERAGGEAWLTPSGEWVLYTAELERVGAPRRRFNWLGLLRVAIKNRFLFDLEHDYYDIAGPLLKERREPDLREILRHGSAMLPTDFGGEGILTIGRTRLFAEQGAAMVVNVAPFGCMPGTITSALCRELQGRIGIPVVSLFYDGEQDDNQRLVTFLNNLGVTPPHQA